MRVLVTGASGFVGRKLFTSLSHMGEEVVGTYFTHPHPDLVHLDVTDKNSVRRLFTDVTPELVIHTAGMSRPDECETNVSLAIHINIIGTKNIADLARELGVQLVYPSSLLVFDGEKKRPYKETAQPRPLSIYGETKQVAERHVQQVPGSLILRSDMMYGYNGDGFHNGFLGVVASGTPLTLDAQHLRQPLLVDDLAHAITILQEQNAHGIFHLAPREGITTYELALKLKQRFGGGEITPGDPEHAAPRPSRVVLDTTKAESFGVTSRSVEESLVLIEGQIGPNPKEGSRMGQVRKET